MDIRPGDVVIAKNSFTPRTVIDTISDPADPANPYLLILEGRSWKEDATRYITVKEAIQILSAIETRRPKPALEYQKRELANLINLPPLFIKDQQKEIERRKQIIKELRNAHN